MYCSHSSAWMKTKILNHTKFIMKLSPDIFIFPFFPGFNFVSVCDDPHTLISVQHAESEIDMKYA